MVKAKVYIFRKQFEGFPKKEDLEFIEEELPPLKDGEFLCEAVYLSVDPYMRSLSFMTPIGSTFHGGQVAKIIESKNQEFPKGKYVVGYFGWRTHTISDGSILFFQKPYILPDIGDYPLSLSLGVLGMPGNTAYFGFLEICKPKPGQTVVVTGAAGAVGNLVGQIAKIKGCKVIGIAGSDEKGRWLTDELGFDHVINYKIQDVDKVLGELAPEGVDCYFDNVGGDISFIVMNHMNRHGRISVCGASSAYNDPAIKTHVLQIPIIHRELAVEGLQVGRWNEQCIEGIKQMLQWLKEGRIKYRETVHEGFENMFPAFSELMAGKSTGKIVVKV